MTTLDPQSPDLILRVREIRIATEALNSRDLPNEVRTALATFSDRLFGWELRALDANERDRVLDEQESVLDHQREPGRAAE